MEAPSGEVKRVADVVLGRILDGAYPPGLRLPPETALAAELGCGRSTLREALRDLARLGLVQSRRGSGALVRDFRREGTPALLPAYVRAGRFEGPVAVLVAEMLRLRTLMATEAVRLAARHAPAGSLRAARARLEHAPALENDPAEHAANELELYKELVVASGMWPAVWLVNSFWTPLGEINRMFAPASGGVDPAFQATMVRLLALIEVGDDRGAVEHARAWFERVDAKLVAVIEGLLGAAGGKQGRAGNEGGLP
jgi:DNA-binding FadR family transcriptional regulator